MSAGHARIRRAPNDARRNLSPPSTGDARGSIIGHGELSIPRLWRSLWRILPGRRARQRDGDRRRSVRCKVLVYSGRPDVLVTQPAAREWVVRVTAPADWKERVRALGLAVLPDRRTGRPGLVLGWRPAAEGPGGAGWIEAWVLRRERATWNRWIVCLEPHPDPRPELANSSRVGQLAKVEGLAKSGQV